MVARVTWRMLRQTFPLLKLWRLNAWRVYKDALCFLIQNVSGNVPLFCSSHQISADKPFYTPGYPENGVRVKPSLFQLREGYWEKPEEMQGKWCCSQRCVFPFLRRSSSSAIDPTGTSIRLETGIGVFLLELHMETLMTSLMYGLPHGCVNPGEHWGWMTAGKASGESFGGDPETSAGDEFNIKLSSFNSRRFGFRLTLQWSSSIHSQQECCPESQSWISLGKKTYLRNDLPALIGLHFAGHLYI